MLGIVSRVATGAVANEKKDQPRRPCEKRVGDDADWVAQVRYPSNSVESR